MLGGILFEISSFRNSPSPNIIGLYDKGQKSDPPPVRVESWSLAKQCEMKDQKELYRNGYGGQAKVNESA